MWAPRGLELYGVQLRWTEYSDNHGAEGEVKSRIVICHRKDLTE